MKDFLDGKAVRVPASREGLTGFLRQCDEYGLRWADGCKATKLPLNPYRGVWYICREPISGGMIIRYEAPKSGFKDIWEVRQLKYSFGQFIRGDFALHVLPKEMADFLDTCSRNRLLWVDRMPPRAGMKGVKVPKDGIYVTCHSYADAMPIMARRVIHIGFDKPIVEFRYVPRNYKAPQTSTLDDAREMERAARLTHDWEPQDLTSPIPIVHGDCGATTVEKAYRQLGLSPDKFGIVLIINDRLNPRITRASQSQKGTQTVRLKEAACSPRDAYSFETGAMVALARLFGYVIWERGAKEVEELWAREGRKKVKDMSKNDLLHLAQDIVGMPARRGRDSN